LLSPEPHALYSGHDILLLGQESVAQIGSPADVRRQAMQQIGHHDERLNTGVPWLRRRRRNQGFASERRILIQPLRSLHDFQRISGCGQKLTKNWIRVESHRSNQAVQLIRGE
jgi:hypothetical protein